MLGLNRTAEEINANVAGIGTGPAALSNTAQTIGFGSFDVDVNPLGFAAGLFGGPVGTVIGGAMSLADLLGYDVPGSFNLSEFGTGPISREQGLAMLDGAPTATGGRAGPGGGGAGDNNAVLRAARPPTAALPAVAAAPTFARPGAPTAPAFLSLPEGATPLQLRSHVATRGTQGGDPRYLDPATTNYFYDLLRRDLVGGGGAPQDYGRVLPVEHQYLRQLGKTYQPNTTSLLQAIAAA